jgi:hypothetical protein
VRDPVKTSEPLVGPRSIEIRESTTILELRSGTHIIVTPSTVRSAGERLAGVRLDGRLDE